MCGDGMGAMALGISLIMIALPIGGLLFFSATGYGVAKWRGGKARAAWRNGVILGAIGLTLGTLTLIVIFYPSVWRPRPEIRFILAPDSDPGWIVLLEDHARGRPFEWRGVEMPFVGISTTLRVPRGGVVRVSSLDKVGSDANVVWPDGATALGGQSGPMPASLGASSFVAWTRRADIDETGEDIPYDDQERLAWLRRRERIR